MQRCRPLLGPGKPRDVRIPVRARHASCRLQYFLLSGRRSEDSRSSGRSSLSPKIFAPNDLRCLLGAGMAAKTREASTRDLIT